MTSARITVGKRQHEIGDPHDRLIDDAPDEPRGAADGDAQSPRQDDRGRADRDRQAGSVEDPAEDVSPKRIGAQPVISGRRAETVDDVLGEGQMGRQQGGGDRRDHPGRHEPERGERQRGAGHLARQPSPPGDRGVGG
jgi:hypothetical protein